MEMGINKKNKIILIVLIISVLLNIDVFAYNLPNGIENAVNKKYSAIKNIDEGFVTYNDFCKVLNLEAHKDCKLFVTREEAFNIIFFKYEYTINKKICDV